MIAHVVLFAPRPNLSHDEQQALLKAFEYAVTNIPTVRRVRLGRRVRHGAGYEGRSGAAEFIATIAFDDLAGLRAYLGHPAHEELGRQFGTQLDVAEVYDFEEIALDQLAQPRD
ncbi:MAG: Dabb family protein [Vicinamibacterales bacterium]